MIKESSFQTDSPEARQEGHRKLERFIHLQDVITSENEEEPKESLEDPETRLETIKSMDTNKFLDILSISNGLLRGAGFTRWKGEAANSIVSFGGGSIKELEPPEHAEIPFTQFFEELRQNISAENKDVWAVKLYVALIFAHLFPDGNGRLARNAYSFIKNGHILEGKISSERGQIISKFCKTMNYCSIMSLLQKEGIYNGEDANEILDYQAKEKFGVIDELPDTLKYIAAYRIGLVKNGEKKVFGDNWTEEEHTHLREEYQKVRIEWYQESQALIDQYDSWAVEQLEKALGEQNEAESQT